MQSGSGERKKTPSLKKQPSIKTTRVEHNAQAHHASVVVIAQRVNTAASLWIRDFAIVLRRTENVSQLRINILEEPGKRVTSTSVETRVADASAPAKIADRLALWQISHHIVCHLGIPSRVDCNPRCVATRVHQCQVTFSMPKKIRDMNMHDGKINNNNNKTKVACTVCTLK